MASKKFLSLVAGVKSQLRQKSIRDAELGLVTIHAEFLTPKGECLLDITFYSGSLEPIVMSEVTAQLETLLANRVGKVVIVDSSASLSSGGDHNVRP